MKGCCGAHCNGSSHRRDLENKMDDAIATLVTEGTVTAKLTPRGGMMYYLNGRRGRNEDAAVIS